MNKTILIIASILFITSAVFPQSKVNIKYLDEYGGKKFKQNDDKPFTGIVFDLSKETGNKISETKYVQGIPHGKHVERYNDGKKKVDGTYKSGVMDGKWTWYNENEKTDSSGIFKDGIEDGLFTSWHENGQKESEGTFKDGKKDEKWTYYTEVGDGKYSVTYTAGTYNTAVFTDSLGNDYTGSLIGKRMDKDGTYLYQDDEYHQSGEFTDLQDNEYDFSKFPMIFITIKGWQEDGLYIFWYENGQKWLERTYRDGKLDGLVTEWYVNGQKLSEGTIKDGKEDGLWTTWHKNGQKEGEGTFKDGKEVGKWTYYNEDGSIKEPINYETTLNYKYNSVKRYVVFYTKDTNKPYSGQVFSLYEDGKKKEEGTYKDGIKKGVWTFRYDNGQKKSERTFKDGKRDGISSSWYEDGQKMYEGTYKDGKQDGLSIVWYENGQKKMERTRKDGKREGLYVEWYENGQKKVEGTYNDGKEDGLWTEWRENGQKKVGGRYKNGELLPDPKVTKLIESIASNTVIELEDHIYDLTPYESLLISNINNLTIKGNNSEIIIRTVDNDVITITNCNNITLDDIKVGHYEVYGCFAPVIGISDSKKIDIQNCSLYGSGTSGIKGRNSKEIIIQNSSIIDCSYSIATLYNSELIMKDCTFSDNGGGIEVSSSCSIQIDKCVFKNNYADKLFSSYYKNSNVVVKNSTFRNNGYSITGLCIQNFSSNTFDDKIIKNQCD